MTAPLGGNRVCVATTVHFCLDTRVYYREVRSLSEEFVVDYYAPRGGPGTTPRCSGEFFPLHKSASRPGRVLTQLHLVWLLLRRRYDVYHFHDPELLPLAILLKSAGRRVIFDVHENVIADIGTKHYLGPRVRRLVLGTFTRLFRHAQGRLDRIILAEKSYRELMVTDNYRVVLNFPVLRQLPPPPTRKRTHGLVYVGSITEERGLGNMLEIFAHVSTRVPGAVLHLVGPLDGPEIEGRISAWLGRTGLGDRVVVHGRIPNEHVYAIMQENDVGLCLLSRAVFGAIEPTKIYEYMMAGLPVVATDCPLWREIVQGSRCGLLVDPERHRESADLVVELLLDEERLAAFGRNGLRAVATTYNWATERAKLLDEYRLLLHGPDGRDGAGAPGEERAGAPPGSGRTGPELGGASCRGWLRRAAG